MPIPEFVVALREKIGTMPLWLSGTTAVVLRGEAGTEQVLLVRRSDTGEWTPITGGVEPGEEPAVAARREALEEASVVVEPERLVWVVVTDPIEYANGDRAQYLDTVFRCRYVSGDAAVGDDENIDVRWYAVGELPEMAPRFVRSIELAIANAPEAVFQS
ncbi:NUDIX domain-containing protein [Planctomonas sp. JC2975]|uniref:NUDIX hydrolase n=1 Tax=Planctomonas sp. JC2975 TaxID=2729626 RepID=UPI0014755BE3|nr:NUDIX domain-containing protein [Planctomonas sp. JC2975]NNC12192.1 NUDIX domain-containing protein [Planctomonas sp. JC2975]